MSDDNLKVILIGESGVGKTCLINVSTGLGFDMNEKTSLTASYLTKKIIINGIAYTISLWDTVGQEKLRNLTKIFFKNSKIVIFVYDITSKKSFEGLESWEKDVKELLGDNIVKGVVGNKQDLFMNEEVTEEEGSKHANSINAKFRLVSAKTDPESFNVFLEELLKDYLKIGEEKSNNIKLSNKPEKEDVKKKKNKIC